MAKADCHAVLLDIFCGSGTIFLILLFSGNCHLESCSPKQSHDSLWLQSLDVHLYNIGAKLPSGTFERLFLCSSLKFFNYHAVTIPTDCNSTFESISL